jgi:hypothetical protein
VSLGRRQIEVLSTLAKVGEVPPTAEEIAWSRYGSSAWAGAISSALRRLHKAGLVTPLGQAASGARTWAITDAGRQALEADRNRHG